jgi:hypothetical protein
MRGVLCMKGGISKRNVLGTKSYGASPGNPDGSKFPWYILLYQGHFPGLRRLASERKNNHPTK